MKALKVIILGLFGLLISNNVYAETQELAYLTELVKESFNSNITTNSLEIIKLKNIDFHTDVKDKLVTLCKQENTDVSYCNIGFNGDIALGTFTYGNLVARGSQAFAFIGTKGELLAYHQRGKRNAVLELEEVLMKKYGQPKWGLLDRRIDFRTPKYWKDSVGTLIVTENHGFYNKDIGSISIISSTFIDNIKRQIEDADKKYKDEQLNKRKEALKNL